MHLYLLSLLFPFASVLGAPLNDARELPVALTVEIVPRFNVCNLPVVSAFVCKNNEATLVVTPMGLARGVQTTADTVRFSVKYANAARFQPPTLANSWTLPRNLADTLPPPCPQPGLSASEYSEDCLYLNIYAPASARPNSNLPIMVWVHGGSYVYGSTTNPGLDGSGLAVSTNSIVITVQYRLGVLGYLPPTEANNKNLGVQDVITALQYIRKVAPSFGGDKNKITLAGQSSGANMVRNVLAAPSAAGLFSRGILHSDPVNYGFLSPTTYTTLQSAFYDMAACGSCLTTPVDELIAVQEAFSAIAYGIDQSAGFAQPIRPVLDGTLITTSLTTSFPSSLKPILLTTVKDEGAPTIYNMFGPLPGEYFETASAQVIGADRAAAVSSASYYPHPNGEDSRPTLVKLGTDWIWRCPTWSLARTWAARGGMAFVGEFTAGATYPSTAGFSYCTSGGVCHEDDIYILFGTTPNPTAAQSALTAQVQARWASFIKGNAPNAPGSAPWAPVSSSGNVNALNLGGSGTISADACTPTFWGNQVKYDYQVYRL